MTEHILFYMAGVFDGEGTITLTKKTERPNSLTLKIAVYNTDRKILDPFIEQFGGTIYEKPDKRRSKMCMMWQCPQANVFVFCQTMVSRCLATEKVRKMKVTLNFWHKTRGTSHIHLEDEIKEKRQEFYSAFYSEG